MCKEQDRVRELDTQDTTGELARKVGQVVGRNVKKVLRASSVSEGVN